MKRNTTQVLSDFFGDDAEGFALKIVTVLHFMLSQKKHKKSFQKILKITLPDLSLNDFKKAVLKQKALYEKQKDEKQFLISNKIETSGKVIVSLKDSPVKWLFISIYWAYNFRDNSTKAIQEKYDHRIGDIALTFILQSNRMKKMEISKGIKSHADKFYTNLSVRLVRVIEILVALSNEKNTYIDRVYFPDKIDDLALNFLHILSENRFEKNTIDIAKTEDNRSVMQYKSTTENIELYIASTRMLKDGFMSDINRTYNEYQQFLYLTPVGDNRSKNKTTRGKKLARDYYVIDDDLIPAVMNDPNVLNQEENIELSNKTLFRRDDGKQNDTMYIHSALEQHQINKAFSSVFTKSNLLLASDYNVPKLGLLSKFIHHISGKNHIEKFYKSLFIVSCVLGSKTEDIILMIAKNKNTPISIKGNVLSIKIDNTLFAKNSVSELLEDNRHMLMFELPNIMSMLIAKMQRDYEDICKKTRLNHFQTIKFTTDHLLNKTWKQYKDFLAKYFMPDTELNLKMYKEYIDDNTKIFSKHIVIKTSQTHRYLPHFLNFIGEDLLTAKMATAVYSRNDQSKLAYTSTRTNAAQHSQNLKIFWEKLNLDYIARPIIGLASGSYKTVLSPIPKAEFSGSSRLAKQDETKYFFDLLRTNIDITKNENDRFNLTSMYVRYAMSLLMATREFKNSANFESWIKSHGFISINEKAQTLAMGVRYIPICERMHKLLEYYESILSQKGLPRNVYLYIGDAYEVYTPQNAKLILENMEHLKRKTDLEKYISEVPCNTGRHVFSQKALEFKISDNYTSAFLGHYGKGEEQQGMWSTIDMKDYHRTISFITNSIACIYNIKELQW
jgi:hypothetical protein